MMVSITAKPEACRPENAQHYVIVGAYEHAHFRVTRDISRLDRHPQRKSKSGEADGPQKKLGRKL